MAISVAPPPGQRVGLKTTFRATDMASARFRSISLRMSLEGPRRRIVQALGEVHLVRKVKYLRERGTGEGGEREEEELAGMRERSEGERAEGERERKNSLVSELLDVEKTTLSSNVDVSKVLDSVDDGSSDGSSYTVVVRLSDSSDGGDVGFEEVVLSEICKGAKRRRSS